MESIWQTIEASLNELEDSIDSNERELKTMQTDLEEIDSALQTWNNTLEKEKDIYQELYDALLCGL